jgi:hypothetical protein
MTRGRRRGYVVVVVVVAVEVLVAQPLVPRCITGDLAGGHGY